MGFSTAFALLLPMAGCDFLESLDAELADTDVTDQSDATGADAAGEDDDGETEADTENTDGLLQEGIDALAGLAAHIWDGLPYSQNWCDSPYTIPEAGIFTFYCHLIDEIDYAQVQDVLGISIFLSGPHENGIFDTLNEEAFGHYNPLFVRTLSSWTLPAAQDSVLRRATHFAYTVGPQHLARTMWATHQKLKANPAYWQAQQDELQSLMANGYIPWDYYEKFSFLMNPLFMANHDAGDEFFYQNGYGGGYYDDYQVKIATGFWIRRGIDGTAEDFAAGLYELLDTYDWNFLEVEDLESPPMDLSENWSIDD